MLRTVCRTVLASTLALTTASSALAAPTPAEADAAASNDFQFAMYGVLRAKPGNLFLSGPSMRQALGLAYLGARGATAKQMKDALGLDADPGKSALAAREEIDGWKAAKGGAELSIANRLWADATFKTTASFADLARRAYGAPVDPVDFLHAADASRLAINKWVSTETHAKINDLLPPGSVTPGTRLVIANAVYFKGTWAEKFAKAATRDEAFHAAPGATAQVPTMHAMKTYAYASGGGAAMLEIKYANSDLAMDVLLPDDPAGLDALERGMTGAEFASWSSRLAPALVDVSLPKFKFSWGAEVGGELGKLGVKDAFDEGRADFGGIAASRDPINRLHVSAVFHKAFVAVDEEGTEAAAATGVVMVGATSVQLPPKPIVFKADHPFVFAIRDVKRGRVLFVGRVTSPKS